MITPEKLLEVANAQTSGFLKDWKARSIVMVLSDSNIVDGGFDKVYDFVQSSLTMEGFTPSGIANVVIAILKENKIST